MYVRVTCIYLNMLEQIWELTDSVFRSIKWNISLFTVYTRERESMTRPYSLPWTSSLAGCQTVQSTHDVHRNRTHSTLDHFTCTRLCYRVHSTCRTQEVKYVERWPSTTSAWVSWSRFDIPVDRYAGVHSLLQCTSWTLGFPTCH